MSETDQTEGAKRVPMWKVIFRTLSDEISGGRYAPGDKLPTEAALSARFGVNRHTVRRAISELSDAGVTHSRRGAGVFVTHAPTVYPIGKRVRYHQNLLAAGQAPGKQILSLETRLADAQELEALMLAPGSYVQVFEAVSTADGTPISWFTSVFPAHRFPDILNDIARNPSVTYGFQQAGIADYTRAWTQLTAIRADAIRAGHLRLPEGAPILRSRGVNVDPEGVPIEFGTTCFAGDRVTLSVDNLT